MEVIRGGNARPTPGGAFTGETELRRLLNAQQPGGVAVSLVRFEDGSRTHWHTHPGEQVLYVLEGQGRAGTASQEFDLQPGDLVYAPPQERHWHGAAPGQSMAHLSVTAGGPTAWFEAPE